MWFIYLWDPLQNVLKTEVKQIKNQNALTNKLEAIGLVGVSLFAFVLWCCYFFPFSRGFACSCDSESIICFSVFKKKNKKKIHCLGDAKIRWHHKVFAVNCSGDLICLSVIRLPVTLSLPLTFSKTVRCNLTV